jgi:alcohol dehydrogenase class IV
LTTERFINNTICSKKKGGVKMGDNLREFLMPTKIVMGLRAARNVGQEFGKYGLNRVMIVTDPGLEKAGVINIIKQSLESGKITFIVFSGVEANPSTEVVAKAYNLFEKENCQGLLGVGGGSSMDTAKAVSILATNGGLIESYTGMDVYKKPPAPLIVIPTTVGTGSEVTRGCVITDLKLKKKLVIRGMNLYPRIAILDPEFVQSLPARVTAGTGMDALTHAIEGYVSTASNPISDGLHRHAILLIGQNLRAAVANSGNIEAIGNMLVASTIAGIAFANSLLGLVHAMSHPVSAHFNVSHGDANAILLPHVMRFNWISNVDRFADIATLLGVRQDLGRVEMARISGDLVSNLGHDIGIPSGLSQVGVDKNGCEMLANEAIQEALIATNPRLASLGNIVDIYNKAL